MSSYAANPASKRSTERWEDEGGPTPSAELPSRDGLQSELERYKITPVRLTVFDWGGYRYSNSKDAIAAAKRLAASGSDNAEHWIAEL